MNAQNHAWKSSTRSRNPRTIYLPEELNQSFYIAGALLGEEDDEYLSVEILFKIDYVVPWDDDVP